ncbi:hypothetical protein PALB_18630 [Pseudoalteromonas luteoviolacea B = ATCC 29581]|nr:hypothetical protein PALB_18630 [Pseudoalteromonas luteoviolacea B = ATCC 29581]
MPIKKWIYQYSIALPVVFLILAGVQYFKGRSAEYSIEFGIIWSIISVSVFAIRRIYNYRKSINCAICNDLPNKANDSVNK